MNSRLTDLTIASGGTTSNSVNVKKVKRITLVAPATLPETVTLQVSVDGGTTFNAFQTGGADVTIAAAKAKGVDYLVATHVRLSAGAAVAADRVFQLMADEDV